MTPTFTFEDHWEIAAAPGRVFEMLARPEGYPTWWPEVRSATRIDADSGRVAIRSTLPYTLTLVLTREAEDARQGLLRVRIDGDLAGWASYRVSATPSGARADYHQVTSVQVSWLRPLVPVLRPLLAANHAAMMRSGRAGLSRVLTSGR